MAADAFSEQTVVLSVLPGEVLDDRWRIETRVGQGAMGSVFRGTDLTSDQPVAIKILSPEHVRKPKVLARFEREAALMTTLRHPNIVQLYGHGRRGVLPYIAMEYLEGLTLAEVLEAAGGSLPLAETIATIKHIASGLAFLHHHGLVHRDIKPQNIFITASGRVIILDLGVVRDLHNPGLTRPGAMVGTPYYMSPEQILGVDDVDKRTDVYALAAMIFELLTGRPPYLGSSNFEVLFGHKNTPPPVATEVNPNVPAEISEVLRRGLAKRRDQRPDSAVELVADLEAIAGHQKLDLARVFPFLARKRRPPTRSRQNIKKMPEEVPMARSSDVISMPRPPTREAVAQRRSADDDERTVYTPPVKTLLVPHAPQLENATFGELSMDSLDSSALELRPVERIASGRLRVVAQMRGQPVKALLLVDGTSRGLTPKTVMLTPGRHEVRLEKRGARSVDRVVEVKVDEIMTIRVELPSS